MRTQIKSEKEFEMLSIETKTETETAVVILDGRLDTSTAPDLSNVMNSLPDTVTDLAFDCEKLEYISSAGIRVVLAAVIEMSGKGSKVKMLHPNQEAIKILEMTRLTEEVTIE